MNYLQSIILGILQGVTEFLPVSSSGHLVLMRAVMNIKEIPVLFDVVLHVSTLAVIIIVFRKRIGDIFVSLWRAVTRKKRGDFQDINVKLFWLIIIATVCTAVVGYGVSKLEMETRTHLVSGLFLVTGAVLILTRFAGGEKTYREIGVKHGIITGLAQGIGVFPGISRSGITISAALFSGMTREEAGEFSFIISIPAIIGALLLKLREGEELLALVEPGVIIAGVAASFIVGFFSLLLLLRLIKGGKLFYFAFYLLPLGILSLIFL